MNRLPIPNTTLASLTPLQIGDGRVVPAAGKALRLIIPPVARGYADAQLDDTQRRRRTDFLWAPPARMALRARASHHAPLGTLGFGFWNDPLTISLGQGGAARRLPASPIALWFFYGSPPNDLAFAPGVAGFGWKAACLQGPPLPSLLLALPAAAAVLLSHLPGLRHPILRGARRLVRAAEAVLPHTLTEWHDYLLEWHPCEAVFRVDGEAVLVVADPPAGPLGFVTWVDNQYAVASPEKGFRFGVIPTEETQWLEIADLRLEAL